MQRLVQKLVVVLEEVVQKVQEVGNVLDVHVCTGGCQVGVVELHVEGQ